MSEPAPAEPALREISEAGPDQRRERIYTRAVQGRFQRIRLYTGWPLLLGYFLLPWLNIDGRQALLFDLPARQFHILWLTFWPQDLPLLAWLLIIAAFALFAVTVWAGRIWCGYTCPQTVWTAIFMWAEQFAEGSRNQRMRLDQAPFSLNKLRRKALKHTLWLGVAFWTGFTFVGYFSPIREMSLALLSLQLSLMEIAWITFFTLATWINAGWLREQVCLHMCPYARFQSVMFDDDTLIVSYDPGRGEPRGARKRGVEPRDQGLGDCIDCRLCVQVCPTGIDIRDGLQYACINCALCIDACDSVMDQMQYPRGLIAYTTGTELAGKPRRQWRPRLLGYGVALLLMIALFLGALLSRPGLLLEVIPEREPLYRVSAAGEVENIYTLRLLNRGRQALPLALAIDAPPGVELQAPETVVAEPGQWLELPLRLSVVVDAPATLRFPVRFQALAPDGTLITTVESRFIGPEVR